MAYLSKKKTEYVENLKIFVSRDDNSSAYFYSFGEQENFIGVWGCVDENDKMIHFSNSLDKIFNVKNKLGPNEIAEVNLVVKIVVKDKDGKILRKI